MIALFRRELTRYRTSYIVYCVVAVSFALLYIALFPSIQKDSSQYEDLLKSMPESMLKAFGFDQEGAFSSIEGFLSTEFMSLIWPIFAIILALSRSSSSIAGAIENKTIGLELSLPTSRHRMYVAKFLGTSTLLILFTVLSIGCVVPLCTLYNVDVTAMNIWATVFLSSLFAVTVYSAGMLVSAFVSEKGKVNFVVGGVLLISYFIFIVANISDSFDWLQYVSIFHYFNFSDSLTHGTLSAEDIAFFLGTSFVFTTVGFWIFRNRDISV